MCALLHLNTMLYTALSLLYSPPPCSHHLVPTVWLTFSHLLLMLSSLEKTTAAMLSTNKFLPMIGPEHSGHS